MTPARAALAALLLIAPSALAASPKPCRDAQGRVIECPKPTKAAPARCKDAAGRFVPCGTPNAKPVAPPPASRTR